MLKVNNIKIALDILQDEIKGDVKSALKKMHKNYSMTWVYKGYNGKLLPRVSSQDVKKAMKEVYVIKGRKYDIKNIVSGNNVVMIEMIESYPDPKTKKVYRTPQVIVLEFEDNKILRGRHYCDPRLSLEKITPLMLKRIYR